MRVIGVKRADRYSPNSVDRDMQILNAVAKRFADTGYEVQIMSEEEIGGNTHADIVFSMARSKEALNVLEDIERRGGVVVNNTNGVRHCNRSLLERTMIERGIECPKCTFLTTDTSLSAVYSPFPVWAKRGEGYSESKDDVMLAHNEHELSSIISRFERRGVQNIVLSEHVEGDLIKFYGVQDTEFFYYYYAAKNGEFSKFGWEQANEEIQHYAFSEEALRTKADRAAKALGVDVYGGDCIITKDGGIKFIDINDWPSFSKCKEKAADAIHRNIMMKYETITKDG